MIYAHIYNGCTFAIPHHSALWNLWSRVGT